MVLNFDKTPEFDKDVKQLTKKWRSLPSDIEKVKSVIEHLYVPLLGISKSDFEEFRAQFFSTNRATILTTTDNCEVVKMRLDCASLGNDKKTRLIFIALVANKQVKLIELYAKNSNERENAARIKKYMSQKV